MARPLHSSRRSIISSLAFSPSGQQALTGSADRLLRTWDARTGAPQPGKVSSNEADIFAGVLTASALNERIASLFVSASSRATLPPLIVQSLERAAGQEAAAPLQLQAILRDIYRPVKQHTIEWEHAGVDIDPGGRRAMAEAKAAQKREPLPAPEKIKVDVKETEKHYTVLAEVPGVSKEDIHVSLDGKDRKSVV